TPWNVTRVQAPSAWSLSTGAGVKILFIDSGIQWFHADLGPKFAWRCISGPVEDSYGHGTHVAGIAAALNNSVHVVGASRAIDLWSANVDVGGAPPAAEVACSIEVARLPGNNPFVI